MSSTGSWSSFTLTFYFSNKHYKFYCLTKVILSNSFKYLNKFSYTPISNMISTYWKYNWILIGQKVNRIWTIRNFYSIYWQIFDLFRSSYSLVFKELVHLDIFIFLPLVLMLQWLINLMISLLFHSVSFISPLLKFIALSHWEWHGTLLSMINR
jgi:hypothetical protein